MYKIKKILNHNSLIGMGEDDANEYLIMGKGIAFGKKINESIEAGEKSTVYSLQELTERGDAKEIISSVSPVCLEMSNEILTRAEKEFGKIDRSILFPMADHIEFAVKRIKNHEQISNPLTDDIRVLFHKEFEIAQCIRPMLSEKLQTEIDEHEIGYIALHIHSAIEDENISQSMQIAKSVRECISLTEKYTKHKIDIMSLSYNCLINHIRYMIARSLKGEHLKVSMNDYMAVQFPESFSTASQICSEFEQNLNLELNDAEIGYLAMHIERMMTDDPNEK